MKTITNVFSRASFCGYLTAIFMFSVASLSSAQSASTNSEASSHSNTIEEVVVTGSRRLGRTVINSNVPIDVVSAETLRSNGYRDINRQLQSAVPSFNFPQPSLVDGTEHVKPASLRGLAPDQTLVLLNGRRRHSSALLNLNGSAGRGSVSVDLNTIPSSAIDRIEVLRDGAAAQYGSDAIGGVINIVTKTTSEGGSFNITSGYHDTTLDGVPNLEGIQANADGSPRENGAARLARINGSDISRTDGETVSFAGNYGMSLGASGYLNITAEVEESNRTDRNGQDDGDTYPRLANGQRDPRELTTNRDRFQLGKPDTETYTLLANAGFDVSDVTNIYFTGTFQSKDSAAGAFFREASDEGFGIQNIYPDGFTPRINADVEDFSFLTGVRSEIYGWTYDASFVTGGNEVEYTNSNTANVTFLSATPTTFFGGSLEYDQQTAVIDFSKLIDAGRFASPISVAFGFEYRKENYEIGEGDREAYTNEFLRDADRNIVLDENGNPQFGDALLPVGSHLFAQGSLYFSDNDAIDVGRHSRSAYGELDFDITDAWNVTLAARYEDYSDFGNTINGKIATRYALTGDFSIRGSVSTGFRAPSLHQQFFTSTVTLFTAGIPTDVGTLPATSEAAMALGGTQLDSEESENISVGFTWTPTDNIVITLDAYNIEIDDRIVLSETLGNSADESVIVDQVFADAGIVGVGAARFFINGVDSTTKGADLTATYSADLNSAGSINISAGFNYNKTELSDVNASVGPTSLFHPSVLFSRRESQRLENAAPETKSNISINWRKDKIRVLLRTNYFGNLTQPGTTVAGDVEVDAAMLIDVEVNYEFTDQISAAIGANNVFDEYPESSVDRVGAAAATQFAYIFPYPNFSPYGYQGRYIYARLGYDF